VAAVRLPRHITLKEYVASATKSDGPFLSMMNLSPATVYSQPRRVAKRFFEQILAIRSTPLKMAVRVVGAALVPAVMASFSSAPG
jgi:hypothetical protein